MFDLNKMILECADGCYQDNLLKGIQNWAGSDLMGKACRYAGSYKNSRDNLLVKINVAIKGMGEMLVAQVLNKNRRWKNTLILHLGDKFFNFISGKEIKEEDMKPAYSCLYTIYK